jgi:DUF1365 family protein
MAHQRSPRAYSFFMSSTITRLFQGSITVATLSVVVTGVFLTATPLILAGVATARRKALVMKRRRQRLNIQALDDNSDDDDDASNRKDEEKTTTCSNASALYTGRVWHSRFQPAKHSFTYPMLMFGLDLSTLPQLLDSLWPLAPTCIQWSDEDHLKNGEGLCLFNDADEATDNSVPARVLRLVAQRTQNAFVPTRDTHNVYLLTNLTYYGYCFNPVSFYLILNKQSQSLNAVVGEVSNTPWLEMKCYVLHPKSTDQVKVLSSLAETSDSEPTSTLLGNSAASRAPTANATPAAAKTTTTTTVRYLFPKTFHVSPFMEMDYWYDWTFELSHDIIASESDDPTVHKSDTNMMPRIRITTAMRIKKDSNHESCKGGANGLGSADDDDTIGPLQFTATLRLTRKSSLSEPFHAPLTTIVPTLTTFPVFGVLTQIWIHYQAALLYFIKKVPFVPHPDSGSDNTDDVGGENVNWATRSIAAVVEAIDIAEKAFQRVQGVFVHRAKSI